MPDTLTLKDGTIIEDLAEVGDSFSDPALEARIDELLGLNDINKIEAKFKVSVLFGSNRSRSAPYDGFITVWARQEGACHLLYICPAPTAQGRSCGALLPPTVIHPTEHIAVCPECGTLTAPDKLTGQIYARLRTAGWAALLGKVMNLVGGNADLELTYMRQGVRKSERSYQEDRDRGRALERFHYDGDSLTYTLARLLQDVGSGTTVTRAIRAFLEA